MLASEIKNLSLDHVRRLDNYLYVSKFILEAVSRGHSSTAVYLNRILFLPHLKQPLRFDLEQLNATISLFKENMFSVSHFNQMMGNRLICSFHGNLKKRKNQKLNQKPNNQNRIRINHQIRVPQVRLILEDGTSPGVVTTSAALKMAMDAGLDLIEINPKTNPPVCKIVDYGKFKYDEKKKTSASKKSQKVTEVKEITFRPNTDENDLAHKLNLAKDFLKDGNKIKFTVKFRGREITHPQVGREKLDWLLQQLSGLILNPAQPIMDGKLMTVMVSPSQIK
jgi:translation initiation factor IF-3